MIGDFNAIMYKEDRIGRDEVLMADIKDMRSFLESCELQELRYIGPHYSWTNRVVRSRIDRALVNVYWYDKFNFTQVKYEANGLSDHTPLLVRFP